MKLSLSSFVIIFFLMPHVLWGTEKKPVAQIIPYENEQEEKAIPLTKKQFKRLKKKSDTIALLIEDCNDSNNNKFPSIYLPNISPTQLKKLMPLFESKKKDTQKILQEELLTDLLKLTSMLSYLDAKKLLKKTTEEITNRLNQHINYVDFMKSTMYLPLIKQLPPDVSTEILKKLKQLSEDRPAMYDHLADLYCALLNNTKPETVAPITMGNKTLKKIIDCAVNDAGDTIAYIGTTNNKHYCILSSLSTNPQSFHREVHPATRVIFMPNRRLAVVGTDKGFNTVSFSGIDSSIQLEKLNEMCVSQNDPNTLFSLHEYHNIVASTITHTNRTNKSIPSIKNYSSLYIYTIALSPNGKQLALLMPNTVKILSTDNLKKGVFKPDNILNFDYGHISCRNLLFSKNDSLEEIIGTHNRIQQTDTLGTYTIHKLNNDNPITAYTHNSQKTLRAYANENGEIILEKDNDGKCTLYEKWDYPKTEIALHKKVKNLVNSKRKSVQRLIITPDDKSIIAVHKDGVVRVIDLTHFANTRDHIKNNLNLSQFLMLNAILVSRENEPLNISQDNELKQLYKTITTHPDNEETTKQLKNALAMLSCVVTTTKK